MPSELEEERREARAAMGRMQRRMGRYLLRRRVAAFLGQALRPFRSRAGRDAGTQ